MYIGRRRVDEVRCIELGGEEYLVEHLKRISAADSIILDKILMTYDEILFFFFF